VELVRNPGVIYPFRIRLSCAGGYKWFNGNMKGVALEEGGTLIYASAIDITDDHNRHRKDKLKDILMSRVLDTTQNCMFWKDTERRFVGVNQAFLDFYGFPSEDVLVGKTDEDMGWHLDPEPFKQDELRVLQGESTYMVHGHCLVHGENRDILASKTPAWDGDEIIGFVGSFMDVTDSFRQQQKIQDLSRELEASLDKERQLNVEMNHFLSRLSHELRTPMNAVIGLSTLGMEQDNLEGALNYLDKIRTSGHYLLQIINEVLEMNKVEAGDIQLNIESASLHDIIKHKVLNN
jgi:PAS domain S-box-containing protein